MIAQGNNTTQFNTLNQSDKRTELTSLDEATNPLQPVSNALGRIFLSDQEQTRIQKVRSIMGDLVTPLADEELETYMTEFQHLIDEWLDEFERQAFDGQTLRQALSQE